MADRINWLTHSFSINDPGASWKEVAGVYIFAGINQANQWVPLYIGQALIEAFQPHLNSQLK
jgi:hypothetical protein